nr:hypothetical protein [Thiomonas sp.]
MADEARVQQRLVQARHLIGRLAVDLRFLGDLGGFILQQKAEPVGALGKLPQGAFVRGIAAQVGQPEAREVGRDDVARALGFGQRGEIVGGLIEGGVQALAPALVFDDQQAGHEAVDEAVAAADLRHLLFVDGGGLRADAEAFIEPRPEQLGVGILARRISPLLGKSRQAAANFVARQCGHGRRGSQGRRHYQSVAA